MVTARESTEPYATGGCRRTDAGDGIYRRVGERIRELSRSYDFGSPMQPFCESSGGEYTAPIPVDAGRYGLTRVVEGPFIVAPEHVLAEANVIERSPLYWLIEEQP